MNQMNDQASGMRQEGSSASGSQAVEAVQQRAEVARDEMSNVAQTAQQEVRGFADEAKAQLRQRVDEEGSHLGDAVRQFGGQLTSMADKADDPDQVPVRAVRQIGERVAGVADRFEAGGVDGVLDDVKRFARRRPGQFILGAAALGFVVGRLIRNVDTAAITEQMRDGHQGQPGQSEGRSVIDLTGTEAAPLPAGGPGRNASLTGGSIAGVAGEEVGTW